MLIGVSIAVYFSVLTFVLLTFTNTAHDIFTGTLVYAGIIIATFFVKSDDKS